MKRGTYKPIGDVTTTELKQVNSCPELEETEQYIRFSSENCFALSPTSYCVITLRD